MKVIAIEEHFITPTYREKVGANEFRNFYLKSRSEQLGHDIVEQIMDLGNQRIAAMDAAGIDVQVLSFGSPGPQAFGAEVAIPMARDANDRLFQTVESHPDRFAGFAALPTAIAAGAKRFEARARDVAYALGRDSIDLRVSVVARSRPEPEKRASARALSTDRNVNTTGAESPMLVATSNELHLSAVPP